RDAQVVSGERVLPEVDHQKPADAVDEIGKIFAEIDARASGHECEIPANCWANAFMGRLPPCQRRARLDRLRDWSHNTAPAAGNLLHLQYNLLHLQQLQMHL